MTDMSNMFTAAEAFNQPLQTWNASHVTSVENMFDGAFRFNQPLGRRQVGHALDMSSMLVNAIFNQPVDLWNVSQVTTMARMFAHARSFNQPLTSWNATRAQQSPGSWPPTRCSSISTRFPRPVKTLLEINAYTLECVANMTNEK